MKRQLIQSRHAMGEQSLAISPVAAIIFWNRECESREFGFRVRRDETQMSKVKFAHGIRLEGEAWTSGQNAGGA